ncbi:MAG: hypothetical protein WCB99_10065 [Candidatus Cybelea sp.]|jgi:hypothetical protein
MPSEFQAMCEIAREGISVPEIPLAAIRRAAKQASTPSKGRKRIVAVVLSGLVIAGAAAAAELWDNGAHVSFGPSGKVQMSTTDAFHVMNDPTPEDLRIIARGATFPVQYPDGLPAGTTLGQVGYGPSIMLLNYNLPGAWRRPNHLLKIWLVDPRALTAPRSPHAFAFKTGGLAATGSVRWNIGRELVIVMRSLATPSEIENIKRAMVVEAKKR